MTRTSKDFTGKTNIAVVLDRSGSMAALQDDTIGGFNTWLAETKKASKGKDVRLTVHLFDTEHDLLYENTPLADVKKLDKQSYVPRGGTALRDAFGATITRLASVTDKGDRALIVVVTDGHENSSREVSAEALKEMITKHEAKKGWSFVYLGAKQDAFTVGQGLGIMRGSNVSTQHTPAGRRAEFSSLAAMTTGYAASGAMNASMTQQDYDAAVKVEEKKDKPSTPQAKAKSK